MNDKRVLVVGHSFISRLSLELQVNPNFDSNFGLIQCTVLCYGVAGATIDTLSRHNGFRQCLLQFQAQAVVLQIGGNDMCLPQLRPETLAYKIIDFMEWCLSSFDFVQYVVVCELLCRYSPGI